MRKIRLLIVMAAMLLSCGIANAQGTRATDDAQTTAPVKGDLNNDGVVNAADLTVLVGIIMETDYFLLGTDAAVPNKSNYTTFDGVVTDYKSIDEVLNVAPTISLKADQKGILLCPKDWEVKDLVLQNEADGTFYALAAAETDISDYALYQTDKVVAATYKLKTKAAAEAYKIKITDFFYLGTEVPNKDNFTTISGVVTSYKSLDEVLKAAPTINVEAGKECSLLCPTRWQARDLVLQNEKDGEFFVLAAAPNDIADYQFFQTSEISAAATLKLKTKADAEAYQNKLKDPVYFWLGTYYPTSYTFPTVDGKEVAGIFTTYTSLADAMAKASRAYNAGEYAVVMYPKTWGAKDDLVFLDATNKKYYAVKKKDVTDFPDFLYYESEKKIGANTTIKLSTKSAAENAGATQYTEATPVNPDPTPVNPDPTPVTPPISSSTSYATNDGPANGIRITILNSCGQTVKFSGKFKLYIKQGNNNVWSSDASAEKELAAHINDPDNTADGWPHWYQNYYTLAHGQSKTYDLTVVKDYVTATPTILPISTYTNGTWSFMTVDKTAGSLVLISAVKLGQCVYDTVKKSLTNTPALLHVSPMNANDAKLQNGKHYHFIIDKFTPKDKYIVQ